MDTYQIIVQKEVIRSFFTSWISKLQKEKHIIICQEDLYTIIE